MTVTRVPGGKPILTGDCAAAACETGSAFSSESRPSLTARSSIGGHHLGDGRRIPGIGGVLGEQHLAGFGFDNSPPSYGEIDLAMLIEAARRRCVADC